MANYPLTLSFKLISIGPQIKVTNPSGKTVLYVKQKALKLKEAVKIFADEGQTRLLFEIKADRILDISAKYRITTAGGNPVGIVQRQGLRSLWKATYNILDTNENQIGLIHEESPMIRFLDGIVNSIPIVGFFAGYILHPTYLIDLNNQTKLYLKKQPAFFEGKFTLEKRGELEKQQEELLIASTLMMLLLERQRG